MANFPSGFGAGTKPAGLDSQSILNAFNAQTLLDMSALADSRAGGIVGRSGSNSAVGIAVAESLTTSGGQASGIDDVGDWNRQTTTGAATPAGFVAGVRMGLQTMRINHLPRARARIRVGTSLTNIRIFVGFQSLTTLLDNNDTRTHAGSTARRLLGVNFSDPLGNTQFTPISAVSGANAVFGAGFGPVVAVSTIYLVTIECLTSVLARLTVNGVSTTLAIPADCLGVNWLTGISVQYNSAINSNVYDFDYTFYAKQTLQP